MELYVLNVQPDSPLVVIFLLGLSARDLTELVSFQTVHVLQAIMMITLALIAKFVPITVPHV